MSEDDVRLALKSVIDPELGINIVDLGLVYRVTATADAIDVAMTMTTPSCPLGEMLMLEAAEAVRERFPEVPVVRVELVWKPPWSPDLMSAEGRQLFCGA
jgi:metal-sulfur cluster biosynthetic enzyme